MSKNNKSINDVAVLLEDMNGKFDFMLEILVPIKKQTDRIPKIEQDIEELKIDMQVIKFAAQKTNQNVAVLDERVTRLEASSI